MEIEDYGRGGKQKSYYSLEETAKWPCPLCGSHEAKLIKVERGTLGVVECSGCKLIRINPRLTSREEVYQDKQELYREEYRMVVQGKAPHHRDDLYLRDLAKLEKYKPTGNFLDIGTNMGSFLRLARNRGWKLTGVEPSPQLGGLAREWWGLDIVEGFLETVKLPAHYFDIVTMTDVFEHVVNPKEVLQAVRKVIKPDGILYIKVPNGLFNIVKYKVRRMFNKSTANDFDAYEHVLHYSEETLRNMLKMSGFEPVEITVEEPVQIPVWHKYVGSYYQHKSPWSLAWKTYTARTVLYWAARVERVILRKVGWLAPNIGCIARPVAN